MEILIRPKCSRCGKDIVVIDPATGQRLQTTEYGEWNCEGCFKQLRHARAAMEEEGQAMRKYVFGMALSAGHSIGPPRRLDIDQSGGPERMDDLIVRDLREYERRLGR